MNKIKNAVILAAGMGYRIRNEIDTPKGFIDIDKSTLIERSIVSLFENGIENIFIGTGYMAEMYHELSAKNSRIHCVHSNIYDTTGSMFTLYNMRNHINDDFILLESDLLYDSYGVELLLKCNYDNAILVSNPTGSDDEVYVESKQNNLLFNMSKRITDLTSVYGEFVGISKVSVNLYNKLCKYYELIMELQPKLEYEYAFCELAKTEDIFLYKLKNFMWCEIDNKFHLDRALNIVLPQLLEKDLVNC